MARTQQNTHGLGMKSAYQTFLETQHNEGSRNDECEIKPYVPRSSVRFRPVIVSFYKGVTGALFGLHLKFP